MCTSQVRGGTTNAAPQWTKKLGLQVSYPDNKPPVSRTTEQKHRLIITDMLVRTALDCCKDFRNLLTRKLNAIEEKGSILF